MQAQLIPVSGDPPITIVRDITLVGRSRELCDLVIEKHSISKIHSLIVKTDGLLFIRDLGSTNGTKVNGQRITRGALLPGDELSFAKESFKVHLGPAPVPSKATIDRNTEMLPAFPKENEPAAEESSEEFHQPWALHDHKDGSDSDVRLLRDDEAE